MTYCFKCSTELLELAMIYCHECDLAPDGDEAEEQTVIRDRAPAPVTAITHVGQAVPSAKRRTKFLAAAVSTALLLSGILMLLRERPLRPGVAGSVDVLNVAGSIQERSEHRPAENSVKVSQPLPQIAKSETKRNIVAQSKPRLRLMTMRIEIIDNIERCYSIPGGREIPCDE